MTQAPGRVRASVAPMHTLDLLLRGAAAGLLLLATALLVRDHRQARWGCLGALFTLGAAAYALYPALAGAPPRPVWIAPLAAFSAANGLVFWLFSRALFDDAFAPRPLHAAAWALFAAAGVANCLLLWPAAAPRLGRVLDLAPLAFAVLATVQVLAGWRADLLEDRRRLRGALVAAVAAYSCLLALARLALPTGHEPQAASLVEAVALAALVGAAVGRLAVLPASVLRGEPRAQPQPAPEAPPLGPAELQQVQALRRLMEDERAYAEEGLTIARLAGRMGLAEHKLRRLINQGLGHRNFNSFVNGHRLDHARRALADPALAQRPVLEIAMDAGFQSLGPFNRAFKAATGLTPSEFRRRALGEGGLALADSKSG